MAVPYDQANFTINSGATDSQGCTLFLSGSLLVAVIEAPTSGDTFAPNQVVPTTFECLGHCVDQFDASSPCVLKTASLGPQAYSVTATNSGLTETATVAYNVADPPTDQISYRERPTKSARPCRPALAAPTACTPVTN
jgi:hypothetical protein